MKRKKIVFGVLFAFFGVSLLSLCTGQLSIPLPQVLAAFSQELGLPFFTGVTVTPEQQAVLWYIRIPRMLVALLVGAGLAASGAVLQGIFSNPLADPGIIGVSSGAGVGAVLALAMGFGGAGIFGLPLFAFLGAILAVLLTVSLSMRHGKIPVMTLLLAGVVVGMLLSAVTAAILTAVDTHRLQQYIFWTIGGLDYRRWEHVYMGLLPIGSGLLIMLLLARHLNVLVLGETEARAVGMNVSAYRFLLLAVAAMTTAASVCISGNIGFVGLVVPHIVRLIVGTDYKYVVPGSAILGAGVLVFCDTLGRVLFSPIEIPAGIIMAFLGAPFFLYLLRRSA